MSANAKELGFLAAFCSLAKTKETQRGSSAQCLTTSGIPRCSSSGNPGTGKTTIARLLFRFLRAYGVLTKDAFVEKNGLDCLDKYCGGTAPKVQGMFREAMGGCLFLDEARLSPPRSPFIHAKNRIVAKMTPSPPFCFNLEA